MKYFLLIILTSLNCIVLKAQTCCSSGVPIASNIGFQSKEGKVLQFSLAVENNRLSRLYSESELLEDNNRLRITNSVLLRLAYNINERLIIETLIPGVNQNRYIRQNNGDIDREGGFGLGDLSLLGQYVIVQNQFYQLSAGGGIKFPTGRTNLQNSLGLLLVNDLQLGSGSTDYLARIAMLRNLTLRPSGSFFLNTSTVFRGIDGDYLGSQSYKFGNEIQANIGFSDQVFLLKTFLYPSLSLRFRRALQDQINANLLANTGGNWLFLRLGCGIDIYNGNRLSFMLELPIFTNVDGTQLSPTSILNLSYYKAVDFSNSDF